MFIKTHQTAYDRTSARNLRCWIFPSCCLSITLVLSTYHVYLPQTENITKHTHAWSFSTMESIVRPCQQKVERSEYLFLQLIGRFESQLVHYPSNVQHFLFGVISKILYLFFLFEPPHQKNHQVHEAKNKQLGNFTRSYAVYCEMSFIYLSTLDSSMYRLSKESLGRERTSV